MILIEIHMDVRKRFSRNLHGCLLDDDREMIYRMILFPRSFVFERDLITKTMLYYLSASTSSKAPIKRAEK